MKYRYGITILACLSLLATGCASIVSGENQSLSVETRLQGQAYAGAVCKLTNDKGQWYVTTPGSVTVHRAYGNMAVHCTKEDLIGDISVGSATKDMAFGNILLGGIIGGGVDAATGAAYDDPDSIAVEMLKPVGVSTPVGAVPQQRPAWIASAADPAVSGRGSVGNSLENCVAVCRKNTTRTSTQCFDACNH